jgi:4-carboxymuconolactone decarboxylase
MSDSERYERGAKAVQDVYAGVVELAPPGASDFMDLMVKGVFSDVWTRDVLPIRDRRLLVMGVIAALGETSVWQVQIRAALENGELTAEQARECIIQLAQYAGYPRIGGMLGATETAIAEYEAAHKDD